MRYYFDASALVKRFKLERGQDVVRRVIHETSLGTHEIYSIYWAKVEFYVAMRRGGVPQKLAARNLRALSRVVSFYSITSEMVNDALNLVYEFNLHAADAVHIAACTELGCEAVLTDDEHLLKESVREYLGKHAIKLIDLGEE